MGCAIVVKAEAPAIRLYPPFCPVPVALLDVNAQNHPLSGELEAAFRRVLRSGQFIMGPEVAEFEKETAAFTGVPHNLGVSSGTDAILLALMTLGIGPGDEVIVPAFTFFATAGCVSRVGATPVFCDVQEDSFNLDPAKAASLITPKTKAIIPVHLFGQMADMDEIMAIAAQHGLHVIEDAAQAFGATYKGQPAGSIGHFGCFSFFPSKNLGALGDAGLLSTRDPILAERARILRVHGMEPKYYHQEVGANFRIDTLQAAFLRVKLRHYPAYTAARQINASRYEAALKSSSPFTAAAGDDGIANAKIVLPASRTERSHIWNQYTIRVIGPGKRDALKAHLQSLDIGCEIYYPLTLDQQPCFRLLSSRTEPATARRLAGEVLSLPIYPELGHQRQEIVCASILEFLSRLRM